MPTSEELFLLKKKAKKAARRARGEEVANLNITSLLDVVSIIVVYLLKSYGSDPIAIAPTAGQEVPMSLADAPLQDGVPVYVSTRTLVVATKRVASLTEAGDIDPGMMDGHSITPLYEGLIEEARLGQALAERRNEDWSGRVIIVGDQNLKFSTLANVMYTAGQAEYSQFIFCVIQNA